MGHYGGSYKVTYDLYKKYGDMRVLDTPICGEHDAADNRPAAQAAHNLCHQSPVLAQLHHLASSTSRSSVAHVRYIACLGHALYRPVRALTPCC